MQNSILPILSENRLIGTGFCIYYNEREKKSYILTCYHVLDGQKNFDIQGEKPEIVVHSASYDMSIVTISKKIEPLVLIDDELANDTMLYSLKEHSGGCIGEVVDGKICEDMISATQHRDNNIVDSLRLEITDSKAEIKKGNSGTPIICKKSKKVIAIANIKYDMKKADKVFALKISYLKEVWKEMPLDLITRSSLSKEDILVSNIENSLPKAPTNIEPSQINQIFLIFNQDNNSTIKYHVEGYIQCENEFDNELIEFTFENIYNEVEQENFIKTLIDEFESDVPIHFIIPPELFLVNFKQWRYRGNELVNRYHILLHNKDRFGSKIRKYKNMIEQWNVLFSTKQEEYLADALLMTNDNSARFDTRLGKIGVCFKQSISNHEIVSNVVDMAKVGLWQYKDGVLSDYCEWVEGNICLKDLNYQSRGCDYMALLWDDMNLLIDLKDFMKRIA